MTSSPLKFPGYTTIARNWGKEAPSSGHLSMWQIDTAKALLAARPHRRFRILRVISIANGEANAEVLDVRYDDLTEPDIITALQAATIHLKDGSGDNWTCLYYA